uniref:Uncharacterized protein n=1 Tax=Romanomermis culicivorax TaxID=13658 RepID=A0A915KH75_ROMCU
MFEYEIFVADVTDSVGISSATVSDSTNPEAKKSLDFCRRKSATIGDCHRVADCRCVAVCRRFLGLSYDLQIAVSFLIIHYLEAFYDKQIIDSWTVADCRKLNPKNRRQSAISLLNKASV